MIHEPEFAQIKARINGWSSNSTELIRRDIAIRPCTKEDLGIEEDADEDEHTAYGDLHHPGSKFYPVNERSVSWVN